MLVPLIKLRLVEDGTTTHIKTTSPKCYCSLQTTQGFNFQQ